MNERLLLLSSRGCDESGDCPERSESRDQNNQQGRKARNEAVELVRVRVESNVGMSGRLVGREQDEVEGNDRSTADDTGNRTRRDDASSLVVVAAQLRAQRHVRNVKERNGGTDHHDDHEEPEKKFRLPRYELGRTKGQNQSPAEGNR